jgi:acyl carrier protein
MIKSKNKSSLEEDVKAVIAAYVKKPVTDIKMDQPLREHLDIDSFGMFELTFEFQEKYNLEIPEEDLKKLLTANDIVNWLAQKGKG